MEPRPRAPQALSDPDDTAAADRTTDLRTWLRLLAACALLVGLAFLQAPGLVVADTKTDLAFDPGGFLARAAHLWDGFGAFGQLQNQAYGYLWPMGPFFWAGDVLGVPDWAVQRAWLALLLCTAFLGAALVTRRLGVRSDLAVLLAGAAYALSPRVLTVVGYISIEAWPAALVPWVLLPLVVGSTTGSPRRAAALSAVAVAMVGGVNAAATFAVLPLGALWLLTRAPGARRRSLMLWWPLLTLVGTCWWLVPLFVLGAYSPPFLDFIEAAENTTFSTTLFDALRGTSNWVPYVDPASRVGGDLIRDPALVLMSGVVLAAGLAGLAHARVPHRRFLSLGLLVGLLMVTFGHVGRVQGWWAGGANDLLDGVLAPLRNVHKFDPLVRLPLVVGLAWSVQLAVDALERHRRQGDGSVEDRLAALRLRVVVGSVVVAVLAASAPAYAGRIAPPGPFQNVPGYWSETTQWLQDRSDAGVALLTPGSSFATYTWGTPRDEPLQFLAGGTTRWAVRNAVPLAPAGNIRALDAIESRLVQGRGSAGLAPFLSRAGVGYLVVRNDLARLADVPDPVVVHQALERSPGIARVRSFGPDVGGDAHLDRDGQRVLVNGGWQDEHPAVEVYAVRPGASDATTTPDPTVVVGGPEDLLGLADLGVLGPGATELATDADEEARPSRLVLTDGLRAVERNFGRVHDAASATLSRSDARRLGNPQRDYLLPDADRWSTWAELAGASFVRASSSGADADAVGSTEPGELPYAALDGDADSGWRAGFSASETAWWEVGFTTERPVEAVRVTVGPDRHVLEVRTDNARVERVVVPAGGSRVVRLDDPGTTRLRVVDASGRLGNRPELREVEVQGLGVERRLRLPELPAGWGAPDVISLGAVSDARRGCAEVGGDVRCRAGRQVAGEEEDVLRRDLALPQGGQYRLRLTGQVRRGDALGDEVFAGQPLKLATSSSGATDPRASALAAVDGDPTTTWLAAPADGEPVLDLSWVDERTVRGVRFAVDEDVAARRPTRVRLVWPDGERNVRLDSTGGARFEPVRTDRLQVRVLEAEPASSLGFDSSPESLPVGVGEMRLIGVPYLPVVVPTDDEARPCGSGPTVTVDGQVRETRVTASASELLEADRVELEVCGDDLVDLPAGTSQVDVEASDLVAPRDVLLTATGTEVPVAADDGPVTVQRDDAVTRRADGAGTGVLALRENTNPGWAASQGGTPAPSRVVDGWQQAWAVSGDDVVEVRFAPDRLYRGALAGGLALLAALVLVVVVRPGRRWGRRHLPPLGTRRIPPLLVVGTALLASGLCAGWTGLAVGVLASAVAVLLRRRLPQALPAVPALLVLAAAATYAALPWGGERGWAGTSPWPAYLVVGAVVAVLVSAAAESSGTSSTTRPPRRRPVWPRRIPGRSTTR